MTAALDVLLTVSAAAFAYQVIALIACLRQVIREDPKPYDIGPVSILKPVRGADSGFYAAIRSHATQAFPSFELLFGCTDPNDAAIPHIERLRQEFPNVPIRLIHSKTVTPNPKVGVLIDLARAATHDVLIVNDGDIAVPKDYIASVTAPLADSRNGLVTCVYSARADSFAGAFEALGIATDFVPSALVAPMLGVNEFGMGATLAFRRRELEAIGGFPSVAQYLADDYQFGKQISRLGKRVWLSKTTVETHLHANSWRDVWHHQVRWARTIRVSRGAGYAGLPITNATLWAILLIACGWPYLAVALLAVRLLGGIVAGAGVLHWSELWKTWWLMPVRDLFGMAVWAAGLIGHRVEWGDRKLRLSKHGVIEGAQSIQNSLGQKS